MGFVHSDLPAFIDAFMLLFVDNFMKALSRCAHLSFALWTRCFILRFRDSN